MQALCFVLEITLCGLIAYLILYYQENAEFELLIETNE